VVLGSDPVDLWPRFPLLTYDLPRAQHDAQALPTLSVYCISASRNRKSVLAEYHPQRVPVSVVLVLDELTQNITDRMPQSEFLNYAARDRIRELVLSDIRANPSFIEFHANPSPRLRSTCRLLSSQYFVERSLPC
jgi:hypothetical protein